MAARYSRYAAASKPNLATALDDVSLRHQRSARKAFESEGGDVDLRFLVEQQLGQQERGRRRLHKAVPAETGGAPETFDLRHGTKNCLVVRSGFVEAGPGCLDTGSRKRRRPPRRLLERLFQELPVDVGDKP